MKPFRDFVNLLCWPLLILSFVFSELSEKMEKKKKVTTTGSKRPLRELMTHEQNTIE